METEILTPSLCASFFTTPSCGDRMTVSIFIDSMLPSVSQKSHKRNRKTK